MSAPLAAAQETSCKVNVSCEAARGCLAMKANFDNVQAEADGMRVARRQCELDKKQLMGENSSLKVEIHDLKQRPTFWSGFAWGVASVVILGGLGVYLMR